MHKTSETVLVGKFTHVTTVHHYTITVPPRWIVEPSDVSVERNRQIALHCQAQGVPTPVIVWKKTTGENRAHNHAPQRSTTFSFRI